MDIIACTGMVDGNNQILILVTFSICHEAIIIRITDANLHEEKSRKHICGQEAIIAITYTRLIYGG